MADALGYKAKIAPEIEADARDIRTAQPHPANARKHDLERIKQSLTKYGQRFTIVVQASTGFVVKGNGTWQAARDLGWERLAMSLQDLDDDTAEGFLYADNHASDSAEYDRAKLIAGLEKYVEGPGLFDTLWTIDELEDLIAAEDAVPEAGATAFTGALAEAPEVTAARIAAGEVMGDKRREIPLVYTVADHALFVGWIKGLQKKWGAGGVMGTVYEAVKRQAELEGTGVATSGEVVTEDTRTMERRAALSDFRDLIYTLGEDRDYRGSWLVAQLNAAAGLSSSSEPTVAAPEPAAVLGTSAESSEDVPLHIPPGYDAALLADPFADLDMEWSPEGTEG